METLEEKVTRVVKEEYDKIIFFFGDRGFANSNRTLEPTVVATLQKGVQRRQHMSMSDEIEKLYKLKEDGAISEDEYEGAKKSLLEKNQHGGKTDADILSNTNMWAMFIHLSQFCGYVAPFAGLIIPIVLWQIKKNDLPAIDTHGRIVANWIITALILWIVCGLLCFIIIGIPLVIALGIIGIIFPIIGAVKANNGEVWRYPCSIEFFKL